MHSEQELEEFSSKIKDLDNDEEDNFKGIKAVHSLLTVVEETGGMEENLDIARDYLQSKEKMHYMDVMNLDYLAELEEEIYGERNNTTERLLTEQHGYD